MNDFEELCAEIACRPGARERSAERIEAIWALNTPPVPVDVWRLHAVSQAWDMFVLSDGPMSAADALAFMREAMADLNVQLVELGVVEVRGE